MTSHGAVARIVEDQHRTPSLNLCIGGIGFCLEWTDPDLLGQPQGFYKSFPGNGTDTIRLRVKLADPPDLSLAQPLFDAETNWRLSRQGSRYIFEIFDTLTQERHTVAFVDDSFREAVLHVRAVSSPKSQAPWSVPRLMQPLGQLLLINRLAQVGGVMVHASAINDRGRGMVFVGPSGAGKSTLAGLWRRQAGVRLLSDEFVILRQEGGKVYAYGTPWAGTELSIIPDPGPVQVEQIFLIEHHPEHRVWQAPEGWLASHLLAQLFLPFWNGPALDSALKVCQDLVRTTPCQRLGFANQASIVRFLRDL